MSGPRVLPVPGAAGPRRRVAWDIAISAVLLVVSYIGYWIAVFFAFLQLSLLTPCSQAPCGTVHAGGVQFVAALVIFLLGVLGTAAVIVLQILRRRSWWAALATLVLTIAGWFVAFGLYTAALS